MIRGELRRFFSFITSKAHAHTWIVTCDECGARWAIAKSGKTAAPLFLFEHQLTHVAKQVRS